jgi:uncharacterized protein
VALLYFHRKTVLLLCGGKRPLFWYSADVVIKTEKDILQVVACDPWMMDCLRAAQQLNLPDWWIGAGFVRNKVWDIQHGYNERTPLSDIDVIYFDPSDINESTEKEYEVKLRQVMDAPWSVKNQARMHLRDNDPPALSITESLSRWPETPTAIAIKLNEKGELELNAPNGVEDLISLRVVATPYIATHKRALYNTRVKQKEWDRTWPKLTIIYLD